LLHSWIMAFQVGLFGWGLWLNERNLSLHGSGIMRFSVSGKTKSTESDTQMHSNRLCERTVWKLPHLQNFITNFEAVRMHLTYSLLMWGWIKRLCLYSEWTQKHLNGSRSGTEVVGNSVSSIKQEQPSYCRILCVNTSFVSQLSLSKQEVLERIAYSPWYGTDRIENDASTTLILLRVYSLPL
jgi:hypothetical protein